MAKSDGPGISSVARHQQHRARHVRPRKLLLPVLVLLGQIILPGKSASAYTWDGCRWNGNAPVALLNSYTGSVSSYYVSTFVTARGWWNNSILDVTMSYSSLYDLYIDQKYDPADSAYARTYKSCSNGIVVNSWSFPPKAHIVLNQYTLDRDLSPTGASLVSAHELGHIYGIDHTTLATCYLWQQSVMLSTSYANSVWVYLNCGGVLPPYPDDRVGVNARYPGGF